jgi:hypothetical protein
LHKDVAYREINILRKDHRDEGTSHFQYIQCTMGKVQTVL